MQKQKTKTDDEKEIERMIIIQQMEELEKDAELDVAEDIAYPPVAISCGTYTDVNVDGTRRTYPIPIGTYGNFSFTHAHPKVGKSFFMSLLVSAYQGGQNDYTGKLKGHRQGRKIIHFDTEQGKFHASKVARRPLVMNGYMQDENYHFYALRAMDYKQRRNFIEYILYTKFAGDKIGLVIIDGVADLTSDVNSMEQSTEVQELLMRWTDDLQCHISTIIHSNYGTTKPTGVLGSALEKKAETQIMLEKNNVNKGWVTVECKRGRNREFDTFSFGFEENGLPKFIKDDFEF
jgi:hypothetical protein